MLGRDQCRCRCQSVVIRCLTRRCALTDCGRTDRLAANRCIRRRVRQRLRRFQNDSLIGRFVSLGVTIEPVMTGVFVLDDAGAAVTFTASVVPVPELSGPLVLS